MSFDSSPRRPIPATSTSVNSRSWTEWTQQLQAYVAWVNSQLRKKPGTKEVKDLRRELQDGTVLVELIEIVANEKIPGAHYNPSNSVEMKENVERVLQFMRSRKIKMHQIRSTDIVEGNMKSIMRLILALAAHFKPSSVKQSTHQSLKSSRSLGIAQEAASTLASIRKDAESIKRKMNKPPNFESIVLSSGNQSAFKPPTSRKLSYGGSIDSVDSGDVSVELSNQNASPRSGQESTESDDYMDQCTSLLEEVQESQSILIEETKSTRSLLVELQNILLEGQETDDFDSMVFDKQSFSYDQLVIMQARLLQAEELNSKLREELSRSKQESMQLQAMKQGLHQRLSEQQQEVLQMKAKQLREGMKDLETHEDELEFLRDELTEKTTMLNKMHTDLERQDKRIVDLNAELMAQSSHSKDIINSLEAQVKDLEKKLVGTEKELLNFKRQKTELKNGEQYEFLDVKDPAFTSDVEQACRALSNLQKDNPQNSSNVQIIESVLCNLVAQVKDISKQSKNSAEVRGSRVYQHRPLVHADATKLLCFTAKSVTPSMRTINKKLEELTLRDFKAAFCSPNDVLSNKRFLFKSLDPEFGTVKEELVEDNQTLPGWEGKVIGWIEEPIL